MATAAAAAAMQVTMLSQQRRWDGGGMLLLRQKQQQHRQERRSLAVTAAARGNAVLDFPWGEAAQRLQERVADLAWSGCKWLTVPALAASSAGEMSFALLHGCAALIPVAMLVGVVLASTISEVILDVAPQMRATRWHFLPVAALFALLKFPGPAYPFPIRVFLPHLANGALWQACYLAWQARG